MNFFFFLRSKYNEILDYNKIKEIKHTGVGTITFNETNLLSLGLG